MDCFIKKIFLSKIDDQVHRQFVRFGKGNFQNRSLLTLMKTTKIKTRGSFEWANDFVNLCSELSCSFTGIILSKEEILGLEGRKKSGLYEYTVEKLGSERIKEIYIKAYTLLLDAEGPGIVLKMKKKLPKPGKGGNAKMDDKFCQIEADFRHLNKIKEVLFWDVPECKRAIIKHHFLINEIVMPKGEKDFEKIRILSKRNGKLIREKEIDGNKSISEIDFEA